MKTSVSFAPTSVTDNTDLNMPAGIQLFPEVKSVIRTVDFIIKMFLKLFDVEDVNGLLLFSFDIKVPCHVRNISQELY